jgi:hypothetical protein
VVKQREVCLHCGESRPKNGHDPCIADLPGVHFACCGHGGGAAFTGRENWSIPYLVEQGRTTYGLLALERMRELGGNPPNFDPEETLVRMGGGIDIERVRGEIVEG